ncbi:MAG TPA: hypothetical protein VFR05_09885, partial [Terriglobia bacterium]|nr:hypothetical protein [Terriglobia bacterium]
QIRKVVMGVVSSVRLDPEFAALPTRVVVDPRGTLYVADGSNGFVRKITTMGIITSLPASVR